MAFGARLVPLLYKRPAAEAPAGVDDPSVIFGSDLVGWYAADQGVYSDAGTTPATNTGTVQQWNNLVSGEPHLSQATSGARPTLLTAGLNSLPTINFVKATEQWMGMAAQSMTCTNAALSFFIVGQMHTETASYGRIVGWTSNASLLRADFGNTDSACVMLRDATNNAIGSFFNSSPLCNVAASLATTYRLGRVFGGGNITPYTNNVAGSTGSASPAFGTLGSLRIGAQISSVSNPPPSAGEFLDGVISEIVVVKKAITDSGELDALDAYFVDHWNL